MLGHILEAVLFKDCVSLPYTINCVMTQSSNEDKLLCLYTSALGERYSQRQKIWTALHCLSGTEGQEINGQKPQDSLVVLL